MNETEKPLGGKGPIISDPPPNTGKPIPPPSEPLPKISDQPYNPPQPDPGPDDMGDPPYEPPNLPDPGSGEDTFLSPGSDDDPERDGPENQHLPN